MVKKQQKNEPFIIRLDENRFVNRDNIDCIYKTDKIPDSTTGEKWNQPNYVIYLKNSRYTWMSVNEEHFNKYVKPFVYDIL